MDVDLADRAKKKAFERKRVKGASPRKGEPMVFYSRDELEAARLREEHRDLDAAIEALELVGKGDQLQIQRLKKRKLFLRDRLSFLEDQLTPDIIA